MKKLTLGLLLFVVMGSLAFAGGEPVYSGKEIRTTPAPSCEWYRDTEWNVGLWGAYAFTGTENNRASLGDLFFLNEVGKYDRFLGGDHAWGGGGDIKYFFYRYFGVGVEGFVVNARKGGFDIFEDPRVPVFDAERMTHHRAIGSVLGTFTLRYPVPCTRFAPYAWAGIGAIFGGGERDSVHAESLVFPPDALVSDVHTVHYGSYTTAVGQFGAGLETRITPNIGWMTDLSFSVIDGPRNNFGMVRTGINFAF